MISAIWFIVGLIMGILVYAAGRRFIDGESFEEELEILVSRIEQMDDLRETLKESEKMLTEQKAKFTQSINSALEAAKNNLNNPPK